jgi:hypothetical protein
MSRSRPTTRILARRDLDRPLQRRLEPLAVGLPALEERANTLVAFI